ncbi:MAG: phosphatase PAP2 family protein [Deltaproteobacteria bacterium]|nr:phosphatase PAP2 family protein [Deltaproteobacteria bacterium]
MTRVAHVRATATLVLGAAVALAAGILFVRIAYDVYRGEVLHWDMQVLTWIQAHRHPLLTYFFERTTALGSNLILVVVAVGACAALFLSGRRDMAAAIAAALLGGQLLSGGLKLLFARPRPDVPALTSARGYAFPSGHAVNSVVFFVTLALLVSGHVKGRALRIFLLLYALFVGALVSVSRLYLGVHYPSDVLGGALVGISWSITVVIFEHLFWHARRSR